MSRHTPWMSRWTRIDSREYRSLFGIVRYEQGAWQGTVRYEEFAPNPSSNWVARRVLVGRFKRPRNAMKAVEERARQLGRQPVDRIRIGFEE